MAGIESIENEVILHGRRNNQAWFEPHMEVIPAKKGRPAEIFIRVTLLTGGDIGPQMFLRSRDAGRTWSNPVLCQNWYKIPVQDHIFEEPWFGLQYHSKTDRLVAICQTHFVRDKDTDVDQKNEEHVLHSGMKGCIGYSLWNPDREDFEPWKRMELPGNLCLGIYYNGQKHEMEDGTILIPGYYCGPFRSGEEESYSAVTVLRCRFDGTDLHYVEHGSVHTVRESAGLHEPSMVCFRGRYFMTVRHNLRAYVAVSEDGLHFGELTPWRFDDGKDLGNYNTQQHWLSHGDGLYLVYNRRNKLEGGVWRSRAPLFMAQVDTEGLCVLRDTEVIVFPEKGARMGNFCIADVSENQTFVVTGEWLQGCFPHSEPGRRFFWAEQFGSDSFFNYMQYIGDLLLARILWD